MRTVKCNVQYASVFKPFLLRAFAVFGLWGFTAPQSQAVTSPVSVVLDEALATETDLTALQLQHQLNRWQTQQENLQGDLSAAAFATYLNDFFLQGAYALSAEVSSHAEGIRVKVSKASPWIIDELKVTGGSPQDRYLTQRHLQLAPGDALERKAFLERLEWLRQNHFLPLQTHFTKVASQRVRLQVNIPFGEAWIPTGNLAANPITGLSVTAGAILDNPLSTGLVARASVKRNNLEPPFFRSTHEIQDWEYVLSLSSTQQVIPGMSVGINHYNKVDYIYPGHGGDNDQLLWIRSVGLDFYSGFQLWEDLDAHRYLRGVFNVSLIEDRFFSRQDPEGYPQTQTQSGKSADMLLLPSFTLSYSDIDDYRIPKNGHFLQGRLSTGWGDATYSQATATGISFWSPYVDDASQWTVLVRSAAGTTFGQSPPFYRGFLNTGHWLVRGATQFSITEKHSVRVAEELHYVFRPSAVQLDKWAYAVTREPQTLGFFDDWALDLNVFLDQGAYWRDSLAWQSAQLSVGSGVNLITPGGSILGLDFALPLYPMIDGVSVMLRLSAPLNFTLYSDWFNSNGFFLR